MIYIDSREKENRHIKEWFDEQGVMYTGPVALKYGDYAAERTTPKVVVERKAHWLELANNLGKHHERFRNELLRARDCGARVVVLVEDDKPVERWSSPRTKMTGVQMAKIMATMANKYPVEWRRCRKEDAAKIIMKILGELR